jgi:hypothetical protein
LNFDSMISLHSPGPHPGEGAAETLLELLMSEGLWCVVVVYYCTTYYKAVRGEEKRKDG